MPNVHHISLVFFFLKIFCGLVRRASFRNKGITVKAHAWCHNLRHNTKLLSSFWLMPGQRRLVDNDFRGVWALLDDLYYIRHHFWKDLDLPVCRQGNHDAAHYRWLISFLSRFLDLVSWPLPAIVQPVTGVAMTHEKLTAGYISTAAIKTWEVDALFPSAVCHSALTITLPCILVSVCSWLSFVAVKAFTFLSPSGLRHTQHELRYSSVKLVYIIDCSFSGSLIYDLQT